ncbi:MAG: hypothetical protein U0168_12250, partial [Nannocystaceae bacterium]
NAHARAVFSVLVRSDSKASAPLPGVDCEGCGGNAFCIDADKCSGAPGNVFVCSWLTNCDYGTNECDIESSSFDCDDF